MSPVGNIRWTWRSNFKTSNDRKWYVKFRLLTLSDEADTKQTQDWRRAHHVVDIVKQCSNSDLSQYLSHSLDWLKDNNLIRVIIEKWLIFLQSIFFDFSICSSWVVNVPLCSKCSRFCCRCCAFYFCSSQGKKERKMEGQKVGKKYRQREREMEECRCRLNQHIPSRSLSHRGWGEATGKKCDQR